MTGPAKRRILFVDDELHVLRGLKRMLRDRRQQWDLDFVESGEKGLEQLALESYELVVSDMRMPGMDGARFLSEVRKLYPSIGRMVLSGHSDAEMILRAAGGAHQYISKPCDSDQLKQALDRALAVRDALKNKELLAFTSGLSAVPSMPALLDKLTETLDDADTELSHIGDIIAADLGMTAKILQLVNSDFFGSRRTIADPREAVELLGPDTVRSLVSSIGVFQDTDGFHPPVEVLNQEQEHGLNVAALARQICFSETTDASLASEAFTAGMLHDIGKVILLTNLVEYYDLYAEACKSSDVTALCRMEADNYGVTHAQVGAYLLGTWGLPDSVVEAVLFHHEPKNAGYSEFSALTALHAADYIQYSLGLGGSGNRGGAYDEDYLGDVGCKDKLSDWLILGDVSSREGILDKIIQNPQNA